MTVSESKLETSPTQLVKPGRCEPVLWKLKFEIAFYVSYNYANALSGVRTVGECLSEVPSATGEAVRARPHRVRPVHGTASNIVSRFPLTYFVSTELFNGHTQRDITMALSIGRVKRMTNEQTSEGRTGRAH